MTQHEYNELMKMAELIARRFTDIEERLDALEKVPHQSLAQKLREKK